ncbi:hypothetical protein [Clostridium beijerinckii]|uniref:hypothetical protein n=1 Tax=Clostridium beijerinckii TaxID=1520 RepID=UPI00080A1B34|nr:hypothetical protein [Clostridium beijerinckii]OCB00093.1 hypothetical protein BGS1_12640 [Clostridium beijerinckii]
MIGLFLYLIFMIIPVVAVVIIKKKNRGYWSDKVIDQIGGLFNLALISVYIVLSIVSFFLCLLSAMSERSNSNTFNTRDYILLIMPVLSVVSISLSSILRIKGKSIISFLIQFLALIIFILNLVFT